MITIVRKQILTHFISLMIFCFLMEAAWAGGQLTLSKTLGKFASIRRNPKVFDIVIPDNGSQAAGWIRLSLASATTPATNLVFLSVWASAPEEKPVGNPVGDSVGWVSIRPPGQAEFLWQRQVGKIYAGKLIFMDVAGPAPLCLVLCPTNESQEIEYSYAFTPSDPGAALDYQFEITVLGYLEGEWQ